MRHFPLAFLIAAVSAAASAASPYSVSEIAIPNHDWTNIKIVSVSRHGTYFVTLANSKFDDPHYLLYGPNSKTKFQDLSASAGPYGPETGGQLWTNPFSLVNDKGISVTVDGNRYALYDHESHTLADMPVGFYPQVLNNRNNAAGSIYAYSQFQGYDVDSFARWDSSKQQLKTINPDPELDWIQYNYPGHYDSWFGGSTDLSDTDEQVGYAQGSAFFGGRSKSVGVFGFEYLVGPAKTLTYGSNYNDVYPVGDDYIYSINDNHQVAGWGYFENQTPTAFVGDLQGNRKLLQTPFGKSYAYSIDLAGEVFGLTYQDGVEYGVWDTHGTPHGLAELTGGKLNASEGYFITTPTMDQNGTIYGTWYSLSDNQNHLLILTKTG